MSAFPVPPKIQRSDHHEPGITEDAAVSKNQTASSKESRARKQQVSALLRSKKKGGFVNGQ